MTNLTKTLTLLEKVNAYLNNASMRKNASDRNAMINFMTIASEILLNSKNASVYNTRIINELNAGYYGECLLCEYLNASFVENKNASSDLKKTSSKIECKTFIGVGGIKEFSENEINDNTKIYFVYFNRKDLQIEIRLVDKSKLESGIRYKTAFIENNSKIVKVYA